MLHDRLDGDSYMGEVFYLDSNSHEVVAKGWGQIDLTSLKLRSHANVIKPGSFRRLLIILKTADRYIAPFALYGESLLPDMPATATYDIRAYLHWSTELGITHPLQTSNSASIIIRGQHSQDSVQSEIGQNTISERLTTYALSTMLASARYHGVSVECSAGYKVSRHTTRARGKANSRLDTFIKYSFSCSDNSFSFNDIGKLLLAFKLYWIDYFDYIDCDIESIRLGDNLFLYLADNQLPSLSINNSNYRSVISIDQDLHTDTLAKIAHFFINPKNLSSLGSSSKMGLAFARIIDYRFSDNSEIFYMNMTSLIFALQSFAEALAEGEIRRVNKSDRQSKYNAIAKVLSAIKNIDDLPEDVRDFYLRSDKEIYKLMARPTFMKSLEVALKKLKIDVKEYKAMLKSIDTARRQVVHGEGYDVEFLLSLLTDTVAQINIGAKNTKYPKIVRNDSEISRLYELLRHMMQRYFE